MPVSACRRASRRECNTNCFMRAVLQRVERASVDVDGETVGSIGSGLLVLLGVAKGDSHAHADYLADKLLNLRIFSDDAGKMIRSVIEAAGGVAQRSACRLTSTGS